MQLTLLQQCLLLLQRLLLHLCLLRLLLLMLLQMQLLRLLLILLQGVRVRLHERLLLLLVVVLLLLLLVTIRLRVGWRKEKVLLLLVPWRQWRGWGEVGIIRRRNRSNPYPQARCSHGELILLLCQPGHLRSRRRLRRPRALQRSVQSALQLFYAGVRSGC